MFTYFSFYILGCERYKNLNGLRYENWNFERDKSAAG